MASSFWKTEVKLKLLTNIYNGNSWTGTIEKICHAVRRYAKTNNKYIKDYGKIKDCHILNNLYGSVMSQKLPVNTFQ